jgi:hypothetical protein
MMPSRILYLTMLVTLAASFTPSPTRFPSSTWHECQSLPGDRSQRPHRGLLLCSPSRVAKGRSGKLPRCRMLDESSDERSISKSKEFLRCVCEFVRSRGKPAGRVSLCARIGQEPVTLQSIWQSAVTPQKMSQSRHKGLASRQSRLR